MDSITHIPITHAAPLIAARELSPVELVRAHIDRVAECAILAGDYRGY